MTWDKNKYKDFKVIKLRRRGPKDGQSVNSYLYGKNKKDIEEMIFDPQAPQYLKDWGSKILSEARSKINL